MLLITGTPLQVYFAIKTDKKVGFINNDFIEEGSISLAFVLLFRVLTLRYWAHTCTHEEM